MYDHWFFVQRGTSKSGKSLCKGDTALDVHGKQMNVLNITPHVCTNLLRLHTDEGVSILEITPARRIQILGGGTCEAGKLSEGHWVMCSYQEVV